MLLAPIRSLHLGMYLTPIKHSIRVCLHHTCTNRALEYRPSCQSCHEIRVLQYVAMESNQHTSLLTHTKKTLKNNAIIYILRKDFVAATCQG